ncbi:MAG: hypothetical protein EZS28_034678 [Streblomastix strix]|uniref:Uncharacterized protein n=1 Tax=Streblomastix strix TaxID=222440 RepID=A0A5J4UJK4_9EUKA|nr:MAG: hypothetical protein EZS28_034678 [Streblomastix strix]
MSRIRQQSTNNSRENEQLDQHAGQPLPVPENQPAKNEAVLSFMKNLLNQTKRIPEEQQHQQLIASAQLLIEQYYDEKVDDFDRTGKSPTKYELIALEDRIQATLGLEINKKGDVEKAGELKLEFEADVCKLAIDCQRATAATIASLATNDAESATEEIFISHRLAHVIAGKALQRRDQALAPPMFRGPLGLDVSVSDVFRKKSKEKLKEQAKTTKFIEHPKEIGATNPKYAVQPAEATIAKQFQQLSWLGPRRHLHRTYIPHKCPNRNESGLSKAIRLIKKNRKLKILGARVRRPDDQHIIIQGMVQKEGIMPQYSMDLGKTSVPDRLMAMLDQLDKIGSIQTIIRGAQPEWISPAAPFFLQSQQQPHQFRGTLEQEQEYMNQLKKQLSSGVVKEMDNVQVNNPTFLVPCQDWRLRNIFAFIIMIIYQHNQRISKWMDQKSYAYLRRYYWRNWHHFQKPYELDPFVPELANMNNAVNKDINIPKQL